MHIAQYVHFDCISRCRDIPISHVIYIERLYMIVLLFVINNHVVLECCYSGTVADDRIGVSSSSEKRACMKWKSIFVQFFNVNQNFNSKSDLGMILVEFSPLPTKHN